MAQHTKHLLRAGAAIGVGAIVLWLAGCGSQGVERFAGRQPELRPELYFEGRTEGWGVMQDRFGTLKRQFRIEATGIRNPADGSLSLTEIYRFDDGQVDRLEWVLRPTGDTGYRATEPRVEGEATGERAGNAFHWRYVRRVPQPDGDDLVLTFDDTFWLQDEGVLIARASVRRFGVEVATLSVFYRKPDAVTATTAAAG